MNNTPTTEHNACHWHKLAILLRRCPVQAAGLLRGAITATPPPENMLPLMVQDARQNNLASLLARHLLAGFLLASAKERGLWPQDRIFSLLAPEVSPLAPEQLCSVDWTGIPLLTTRGNLAHCVHLLLAPGQTNLNGCLLPPCPDRATDQAIERAFSLGRPNTHHCAYWFLLAGTDPPVQGRSLQLPVALAAALIDQRRSWPPGLFATGRLCRHERIGHVAGLRTKQQLTSSAHSRLFLYPAGQSCETQNALGCTSFGEAKESLQLFLEGHNTAQTARYQACLHNLDTLLTHFHQLPLQFLAKPQCEDMLAKAARSPDQHLPQLAQCFSRCRKKPAHARLLAHLFKPEQLPALILDGRDSVRIDKAVLSWIDSMLAHATHHGDHDLSEAWQEAGRQLRDLQEQNDQIRLLLREIVAERFNRYDFRPELPRRFDRLLERATRIHTIDGQSNFLLGAMFGTRAQNFGFCGPAYHRQLEEAAHRAETAFGRRYRDETNRLLNYRIYSLLDIQRYDTAAQQMPAYLNLADTADADQIFRQGLRLLEKAEQQHAFQAALAFRFLAATGYPAGDGLPDYVVPLARNGEYHPWQLICVNLARLALRAHQRDTAELLFRCSIEICNQGGDTTMRVMALLPLALLHRHHMATATDDKMALTLVRWLREQNSLNKKHFACLMEQDCASALLDTVWRKRKKLFPFSYR